MNSINFILNIKSKYILKYIFNDMIIKKKSLELIKYNKAIQKILELKFMDYKEFSGLYSSIEIEIIPKQNKYDDFINFDEELNDYFHLYFDDNKKETDRTYLDKEDKITKIKIKIDYKVKSFYKLFYRCNCIESVYFKKFTRNNIINMGSMFMGCSSLKDINIRKFITTNIINMRSMFYGCSSLKELNLSDFNTNNIIDMSYMFKGCSSLQELNLSNIKISDKTNVNNMFIGCSSLKEINFSNVNINNVNNIRSMFNGCSEELKNDIKLKFKYLKEEML